MLIHFFSLYRTRYDAKLQYIWKVACESRYAHLFEASDKRRTLA